MERSVGPQRRFQGDCRCARDPPDPGEASGRSRCWTGGAAICFTPRQEEQRPTRATGQGGGAVSKQNGPLPALKLEWLKKSLQLLVMPRNCASCRPRSPLRSASTPAVVELLGRPRSTLYYRPTPVRESTLRIMARIDALYLEDPLRGSPPDGGTYLAEKGSRISRDRGPNLMRRMGFNGFANLPEPRTTVPG